MGGKANSVRKLKRGHLVQTSDSVITMLPELELHLCFQFQLSAHVYPGEAAAITQVVGSLPGTWETGLMFQAPGVPSRDRNLLMEILPVSAFVFLPFKMKKGQEREKRERENKRKKRKDKKKRGGSLDNPNRLYRSSRLRGEENIFRTQR